ncbi:hypothetical protein O181_116828 [Austropuccinia psidii MF-1]|uniref:Tet-like 2OG-Fe(II) oxygenase domain-containing protein n=1 Tax=Austropuccinia psidii MF-1 TaxID=1389203 RepID=A0A9Q3PWX9_9BASI|nr:hypothetical protein [Austropuccinia psidii MF-1]
MNRLFSSSRPTAQISMPVSANMTPSEIWRVLIALIEFQPFTTMSEVKVNQWDELSQFLFCKKRFTEPIATNGAFLEGFIFAIGWCKCSKKNEQFGLYGSVGKIENKKDEWRDQGANLSSVPTMLKAPYTCAGCQRFTRKSLRLYKLPTIQRTRYGGAGSQYLPRNSLRSAGS